MTSTMSTDGSTPTGDVVNSTAPQTGVNAAQTPSSLPSSSSSSSSSSLQDEQIRQLNQRLNALMSEKDKANHLYQQAVAKVNELEAKLLSTQTTYDANLAETLNTAKELSAKLQVSDSERVKLVGKTNKLVALAEKPHLFAYADVIPEHDDPAKIQETIAKLEQAREAELAKLVPTLQAQTQQQQAAQSAGQPNQQQQQTVQSILQSLYGNRANMNPNFIQPPATPGTNSVALAGTGATNAGSNPAQMNPQVSPTDVNAQVTTLFAEARRIGTNEAYESAKQQAIQLANAMAGRA